MKRIIVLFLFGAAAVSSAWAQSAEIGVTGGYGRFRDNGLFESPVFGGPADRYEIDNGVRIGARLAFNNWNRFGYEFAYAWQHGGLSLLGPDVSNQLVREDLGSVSIQNVYFNLTAHATGNDSLFRPFVTGGGGFSTFFPPGTSSLSGRGDTKYGFNYGGGLKVRLSDKFGLRFDVRDHVTGKPFFEDLDGSLHNVEYSATFSLLF